METPIVITNLFFDFFQSGESFYHERNETFRYEGNCGEYTIRIIGRYYRSPRYYRVDESRWMWEIQIGYRAPYRHLDHRATVIDENHILLRHVTETKYADDIFNIIFTTIQNDERPIYKKVDN